MSASALAGSPWKVASRPRAAERPGAFPRPPGEQLGRPAEPAACPRRAGRRSASSRTAATASPRRAATRSTRSAAARAAAAGSARAERVAERRADVRVLPAQPRQAATWPASVRRSRGTVLVRTARRSPWPWPGAGGRAGRGTAPARPPPRAGPPRTRAARRAAGTVRPGPRRPAAPRTCRPGRPARGRPRRAAAASSAQTSSAAATSKVPANTDSRSHSARSAGVHSWWLHSIAARSVWCLGLVPRRLTVSILIPDSSWSASSASGSARSRTAASSIASGMPSSRWHSRTTSARFCGVTVNPGTTAAARWANSSAASASAGSGGSGKACSPGASSGCLLVASRVTPGAARSTVSAKAAQASTRCSQVSRISSSRRPRRCSSTAARCSAASVVRQAERGGDGGLRAAPGRSSRPGRRARRRRGTGRPPAAATRRQSRVLPDARRADDRHQPGGPQQRAIPASSVGPADEAVGLRGQQAKPSRAGDLASADEHGPWLPHGYEGRRHDNIGSPMDCTRIAAHVAACTKSSGEPALKWANPSWRGRQEGDDRS